MVFSNKSTTALGFYQNQATADLVFTELKDAGYRRIAIVKRKPNGRITVRKSTYLPFLGIETRIVNLLKPTVLADEVLVIVKTSAPDMKNALEILRNVKSGHPLTFLFRAEIEGQRQNDEELRSEPLTLEKLQQQAESFAAAMPAVREIKHSGQRLLKNLNKSERIFKLLQADLSDAEHLEQTITSSAEWLLDNTYIIYGSIEEIRRNLPKKYYRELPKLSSGHMKGLPRVYAIAKDIVNATAGKLNQENIIAYLNSYQTVQPLTIGELWAIPLMLRYCLLDSMQKLSLDVDRWMIEGEKADFWGNRLLNVARRQPEAIPLMLSNLEKNIPSPTFHFAEELVNHLFDEESVLLETKEWLESLLKLPIDDVIHHEQMREASVSVSIANVMTSLIYLGQFTWQDIFEAVSPVDAIFNKDPTGIYSKMDFTTRNMYRETVENFAKNSNQSEPEIASMVLEMAKNGLDDQSKHVGYYLIDEGRSAIKREIHYRPTYISYLRQVLQENSGPVYVGSIIFLTLIYELIICYFSLLTGLGLWQTALFAVLAAIPLSEVSVYIINFLISRLITPQALPGMSFKEKIPQEYKTLNIVPMLFSSTKVIEDEIRWLEIRYLANTDDSLIFGLFSDYVDAPEKHMPEDENLLHAAKEGFSKLEEKYGSGKFFLFHRQRVWSKSENAWIGWERKRGKIEMLNRFLMGETLPENILYFGQPEPLKGTRFVITLDSDTQLPKDKARELIEVLAHPLNKPILKEDGRNIRRGYTIIQPRVSTDFPQSKATLFSMIFSEPWTVDPYTQAVSNVYQDIAQEGSYHGKGIYDVEACYRILSGRFPEEHLLSHDLLEGAYVRVGFASNISLFDVFPDNFFVWANRLHRWMRGDWQIIDWLKSNTPGGKNTLSVMNRWKIFDNIRRALLPVSLLFLLLAAWILSPFAGMWTLLATLVLFLPTLFLFLNNIFQFSVTALTSWKEQAIDFMRTIITFAILPYQAVSSLDAFFRVIYRRLISHRNLLQWVSFKKLSAIKENVWARMGWCPLFAIGTYLTVLYIAPNRADLAVPFCVLWVFSPLIIKILNQPIDRRTDKSLSDDDRIMLRHIARKTWRYFDDFVGPQTHWLPPDNFQSGLRKEVAMRTSPTNIGYWFLSVLDAYDFRYVTIDDMIDRVSETMSTLDKLEHYEGHLLNWIDIQTLKPLYPRYISTVDSGNLLACYWTLIQGILEAANSPLLPLSISDGIKDTYDILIQEAGNIPALRQVMDIPVNDASSLIHKIRSASDVTQHICLEEHGECAYWLKKFDQDLHAWNQIVNRYFSWVEILVSMPLERIEKVNSDAYLSYLKALKLNPSLKALKEGLVNETVRPLLLCAEQGDSELQSWGRTLKEAIEKAQWLAGEKLNQAQKLIDDIDKKSDALHMKYLYNPERKLFAIGYNVDEKKLDQSYYDLLASEARLASLVSIANEDVPVEHWWALGRPYTIINRRKVLLSWGGTMFEYLMPLIFNRYYPDSLLGDACKEVVAVQIEYAKSRGIPWGISEAAYAAIDANKTYQYRSFGVPNIGLKRGLEEDLVVSPYSTGLALMIDPVASIANLKELANRKYQSMFGPYGYYESIDFIFQNIPSGERGVIAYAFMAHHQGMFLASINNLLHDDIIANRFHNDPRIKGVESLLYERVPISPVIKVKSVMRKIPTPRLIPFSTVPILGITETPESVLPKANILSNEKYSVMVTNSGGGYSCWDDIEITRWRSDMTRDAWGNFCYIKDKETGALWSASYRPTNVLEGQYTVSFKADKVEFIRKDQQIETNSQITVSPEDNAEIRLITLSNLSSRQRSLELTSYLELVLAPHNADRAHPAFNKMFIETKPIPNCTGLLAFRRLRSPEDRPLWAIHILACDQLTEEGIQYETDRARFIGRGNSLQHPAAINQTLSNTTGTVLDPIFSLRRSVVLDPGARVQVSFITAIASSYEEALSIAEKYKSIAASHRAFELAWNYTQLQMRQLRIHQEEIQLFQKFASRILYPHNQLRASENTIRANRCCPTHLWKYGISGDLPIVVVVVNDFQDIEIIRQTLTAHYFLRLRGLKCDLIILNEEAIGYDSPLQNQIVRLVNAHAYRGEIDSPGGVYIRNNEKIAEEDLTLILTSARVVLVGARGSFRQQLVSPLPSTTYPANLPPKKEIKEEISKPLPFLELPYFNGVGGYLPNGNAYVIYLGPNLNTPQPWINVIANSRFGTMVSEAGTGCSWYGNSQTNRLTPWLNDPVIDPICDAIYIRDEESQIFWSPTPSPVRELDAYRISHGIGYTRFEHNSHNIEQELLIFVPVDDEGGLPMRIQKLKLINGSSRPRRLSVTSYSELILGANKEESQLYVWTEWDRNSQSIFAHNYYQADFGSHLAFSTSIPLPNSHTGDRTEFLGRNRNLSSPNAMKRVSLSGLTGAGLDPCAALQVQVVLAPGETKEIVFILGYAKDGDEARNLVSQCRIKDSIDGMLKKSQEWWDKTLGCIQIDVPDLAMNFALNRWIPYQNLSCRFWGRTAFYQSSGAYGFRDQLQDSMALVYSLPHLTREHILLCASRQFIEGDVQHWWHPPSGGGIRTKISDDLLWLPFVTAYYIRKTGDISILDEQVPFLKGDLLVDGEYEKYFVPEISSETAPLIEHCRRAIQKGITAGPNGIPLIGSGDWNDGMNRVGIKGFGESVWLGWFLIHVLNDFSELLELSGKSDEALGFRQKGIEIAEAIEKKSWDGNWYHRAYFDDGTPIGSKNSQEALIDSLAQSWAVISGAANKDRASIALKSAEEHLVGNGIVRLLTPPFDKITNDPGYIKGYPPGVRENGGQYTHGSLWMPLAFARLGDGDKAVELLRMLHPVSHTKNVEELLHYKIEPYVLAGDVYDLKDQVGRGGWSWYSGSAGWMYRVWLEEVLGFDLQDGVLQIKPTIPKQWDRFSLHYRYKNAMYHMTIENPLHINRGKCTVELDGKVLEDGKIRLQDDSGEHQVKITIRDN